MATTLYTKSRTTPLFKSSVIVTETKSDVDVATKASHLQKYDSINKSKTKNLGDHSGNPEEWDTYLPRIYVSVETQRLSIE